MALLPKIDRVGHSLSEEYVQHFCDNFQMVPEDRALWIDILKKRCCYNWKIKSYIPKVSNIILALNAVESEFRTQEDFNSWLRDRREALENWLNALNNFDELKTRMVLIRSKLHKV